MRQRSTQRRPIPLLVLGLVLALGAPLGWWVTHRSSGVATYDSGTAAALAGAASSSTGVRPTSPPSTFRSRARTSSMASRSTLGKSTQRSSPPPAPSSASPSRLSRNTHRPSPSAAVAPSGGSTAPTAAPSSTAAAPPRSSARPAGEPIQIRIASIGVTAPVDAVSVDRSGDMAIPENIDRVGWYRWGPRPSSDQGSIVLAGHVDSAVQGLGAMFRLRQVSNGSSITVTTAGGRSWHYRVVALEEFPKTTVPLDMIFSRTGAARLTVITCGGHFDASKRSYDDNIVVTAVPA